MREQASRTRINGDRQDIEIPRKLVGVGHMSWCYGLNKLCGKKTSSRVKSGIDPETQT
ncbi:hypothetical protein SKAU_G00323690 [Synaphobranchus kaupii]|uniref:Uncharacterized protein n=1 Tax=Synaphobranchus kaupii TaxID=118154 RepID=A0A9Q1EPC1_SYNKA|nr:hypothetical protein SKAU_G00323690 [Synaphobranchus kaupii]